MVTEMQTALYNIRAAKQQAKNNIQWLTGPLSRTSFEQALSLQKMLTIEMEELSRCIERITWIREETA